MQFEVQVKSGLNWSGRGILQAVNSRQAALLASIAYGYKQVRVRPEDSRDKWLVYRF
jgi:hypothetical protein